MSDLIITLGIYTAPSQTRNLFKEIDGVTVSDVPEMVSDNHQRMVKYHDHDTVRYMECIVTMAASAIPYVAKWLFDKLKGKGKNKGVTINGNQITGDNNTVIQIINIIEGKPKD